MKSRSEILEESKKRVREINFGDPVTNICAGLENPRRHSLFVEYVVKTRNNLFGIPHSDYWAKCTDGKGSFWNTDIRVIFPGHLSYEKSTELYRPVHASEFGL